MDPEFQKEFKTLLKKNIEYSQEILRLSLKTRRYILFAQIITLMKIVLIILPIVLAIIYLPPYAEKYIKDYVEILQLPQLSQ